MKKKKKRVAEMVENKCIIIRAKSLTSYITKI